MEVSNLFLKLLVVFLSAKLFAEVSALLRRPSVLGEVIAEIVIGASVFGFVTPDGTLCQLLDSAVPLAPGACSREDPREISPLPAEHARGSAHPVLWIPPQQFSGWAALIASVNAGLKFSSLVGKLAKLTAFMLFGTMALEQLGIARTTIVVAFAILFSGWTRSGDHFRVWRHRHRHGPPGEEDTERLRKMTYITWE